VGVGEGEALSGEAVEVGGFDLTLGVEGGEVAVAEVVGEDEEDVGAVGGAGRGCGEEGEDDDGEREG
jgi:hypothetical protein